MQKQQQICFEVDESFHKGSGVSVSSFVYTIFAKLQNVQFCGKEVERRTKSVI